MAKFKIGDRVKAINVVEGNKCVLNKVGTIVKTCNCTLGVEFDDNINGHELGESNDKYKGGHCWWCRESDLIKVVCSEKIVITTDGKTTTAKMYDGKEVVKTAIAKCSPEDEFDFERGALIAFSRLVNCDYRLANDTNSFDWDAFKNDEFFVQVTADNFESFVKAAEKHDCFFHNNDEVNPFKDAKFMNVLLFDLLICLFLKLADMTKKRTAPENTVFIGYRDNALKCTLFNVEDKPVCIW